MSDHDRDVPVLRLEPWDGPVATDDPHRRFKEDVVLYSRVDPVETLRGLAAEVGVPAGALARYVLARWASEGSAGLLEIGPSMVERLWSVCAEADDAGTDESRLAAFEVLRGMLSWLRVPLEPDRP
ncbi:MAG: DUF6027 family protein [Acidimicrobiia bacterium]